jgi:hypothetical protein
LRSVGLVCGVEMDCDKHIYIQIVNLTCPYMQQTAPKLVLGIYLTNTVSFYF